MKAKNFLDRFHDLVSKGHTTDYAIDRAYHNSEHSRRKQKMRVKKRVNVILDCEFSYFMTFTISPENEDQKKEIIIRKIRKTLSTACLWIANVDYGDQNGRLHFHALVGYDSKIDYGLIYKKYGFGAVNVEPIFHINPEAITKYLQKLTLHALKGSTGGLMYSRIKKRLTA